MPLLAPAELDLRLLLISGPEPELRRTALMEIKEAAGDDDFDLQEFNADEAPMMEWIASVATHPFLAERRTVIVRHLIRMDPKEIEKPQLDALGKLPPTARLVLIADDEQGDDSRQRDWEKRRTSWETTIAKAGGTSLTFSKLLSNPSASVKAQLESRGMKISDKALALLLEMTGSRYSRAIEEFDKLALFVAEGAAIQPADVEAIVVPSREWNVFKLGDAITAGNLSLAMAQLRNLIGTSNKAEAAAFSSVFPTLLSQFRLIWQARLCLEAKCPVGNPSPAVRAMLPAKGDLSKEKDWRQRRAVQVARKLTLEQVRGCLQTLADADDAMKGSGRSYSGIETLEQAVMKLVAIVNGTAAPASTR